MGSWFEDRRIQGRIRRSQDAVSSEKQLPMASSSSSFFTQEHLAHQIQNIFR
jgi:hypothetical protein